MSSCPLLMRVDMTLSLNLNLDRKFNLIFTSQCRCLCSKPIRGSKRAGPARPDPFNCAMGHARASPCRPISYRAQAQAGPYTQTLSPVYDPSP